ncbi:DUF3604 domain-containing protein [Parahaliea mediterranea]|uniref:DUF3604 domain-containing protein n=1 Tax=Parahaliea mediterranea TaxID=651086 RepID=UPI001F4993BF|nr:DUF3604 domain-containing protein [Parahaliea mediterranea]
MTKRALTPFLVVAPLSVAEPGYSPYAGEEFPRRLLWGDTHLHTSLSTDAFGFGVRLDPEAAYRFASGETVTSTWGQQVRLARPLDFLVVADHAESLGMMSRVQAGDPALLEDPSAAEWHALMTGSDAQRRTFDGYIKNGQKRREIFGKLTELGTPSMTRDNWQATLATGERFNRPGEFTALLGYEWTSAPGGSNLHRVVVFRDGADKVGTVTPFSSFDSKAPEDLWSYLANYEQNTGGRVLAIPHNGNLSNGLMFPTETTQAGTRVDADYAQQRQRWEPVYEVTQIKGDGETHGLLSPDDEFADYETWDAGNFFGVPKTEAMLPGEYARSALKRGLELEQRTGQNPYQFGMIGSTDSHTGLATAAEENFFGKHSGVEPDAGRWQHAVGSAGDKTILAWEQAASGYAAVWARENTREAVWDALKRREVYATTGPRIAARLFGGWAFSPEDATRPDIARLGYANGVPMGAVLPAASRVDKAPTFLVAASRDPMGANLDRIQIVKGWLDEAGTSHERVYDVSWSQPGQRQPGSDGTLPPVGNTVDIANATWRNSIGAAELATVWRDPDFDRDRAAFYYARVLEIPTPRWTAYDARRFDVEMPDDIPMITVERAYTSPIWYYPDRPEKAP